MDLVILCGGKGTRLSEETSLKPKPMVEIGGKPILWHIMKFYSYYGINRFILALGYKSEYIKQYFINYKLTSSDILVNINPNGDIQYLNQSGEKDWEILLIDTGRDTLKGGRIKRIEKYIKGDSFHLTYGDGIGDININSLTKYHNAHNRIGTITTVRPPSRFGELTIDENNTVQELEEKPQMGKGLINGGFFIFDKKMLSYLTDDENCDFEFGPLQKIASEKQLKAYKHNGFWQCMDNIRERDYLNEQIRTNNAPWMKWNK